MRIRLAVPDELDDKDRKAALDAALESVTRTVTGLVRSGAVPPAAGEIKRGRIKWKPEPPGDEHFDLPGTVLKRGWGDCDDLAPYHAGSLRAGGIDPGARAIVKRSGPKRWHALVQRSDGSIEDPSLHAGMHKVSGAGVDVVGAFAPIQPPMSKDGRLCLAVCPTRDMRHPLVYFARCDVPDRLEPWDWSSMAAHPTPAGAVVQSIRAVRRVAGEDVDPEDDARLHAVHELVMGADPDEVFEALEEIMGDEVDVVGCVEDAVRSVGFFDDVVGDGEVGSFWGSLGKIVKSAVPIVSKAVQFVPGVGPVASSALDIAAQASQHIPTGGGGGGGGLAAAARAAAARAAAARAAAPVAVRPRIVRTVPRPAFGRAPFMPTPLDWANLFRMLQTGGAGFGLPRKLPFIAGVDGQPAFAYEGGQVVRPWGPYGPAVMRF